MQAIGKRKERKNKKLSAANDKITEINRMFFVN